MFATEQQTIEAQIREYLAGQGIPEPDEIQWNSIPFAGGWGISTPCFPLAAQEARSGKVVNVPQRAQEIARRLRIVVPTGDETASATLRRRAGPAAAR